jgi:peptide/nickel transport system permease protein
MLGYLARRLATTVPVLIGVTILVFLILHLIPGDPAQVLLFGTSATPARVAQLRHQLGLDQALPVQYWDYLKRLLQGDLGTSFISNSSVAHEIGSRIGSTLLLTVAAMAVGVIIGVPLGILAGVRPDTWVDRFCTGFAVLGVAIPNFWFALVLILIFAVQLGWLPSLGYGSATAIILPAVALGWGLAAIIARLLRNNLIQIYFQPYMQVARAKGLSPSAILTKHALKNALIPVVTVLGLQFGNLLVGAVVIEVIFGRTGIGSYLVSSITAKDIPAVQGIVLVTALAYVLINLLVDVLYGVLDPRIRATQGAGR